MTTPTSIREILMQAIPAQTNEQLRSLLTSALLQWNILSKELEIYLAVKSKEPCTFTSGMEARWLLNEASTKQSAVND